MRPFVKLEKFLSVYKYTLPKKHNLVGLDVGKRFVGAAISDHRYKNAIPADDLKLIRTKNDSNLHELRMVLNQFVIDYAVIALVVGIPYDKTQSIVNFIHHLSQGDPTLKLFNTPIILQDESYSTFEAYKKLKGDQQIDWTAKDVVEEFNSDDKKIQLDNTAAAVILQRTLDTINEFKKSRIPVYNK
jgi:RNase H-fold protein (predicted Holliday junction resolvase)